MDELGKGLRVELHGLLDLLHAAKHHEVAFRQGGELELIDFPSFYINRRDFYLGSTSWGGAWLPLGHRISGNCRQLEFACARMIGFPCLSSQPLLSPPRSENPSALSSS